mmetsp:Transcript_54314/g.174138  ORF Transcript_54314/g.174138 Transcript_54314/m.174138 type:complete len:207 (+) Transcript_54314:126-746(+)
MASSTCKLPLSRVAQGAARLRCLGRAATGAPSSGRKLPLEQGARAKRGRWRGAVSAPQAEALPLLLEQLLPLLQQPGRGGLPHAVTARSPRRLVASPLDEPVQGCLRLVAVQAQRPTGRALLEALREQGGQGERVHRQRRAALGLVHGLSRSCLAVPCQPLCQLHGEASAALGFHVLLHVADFQLHLGLQAIGGHFHQGPKGHAGR